jgi:two-component system NarL family sensor kinase
VGSSDPEPARGAVASGGAHESATADLIGRFDRMRAEQERLLEEMLSVEQRSRALARRVWRVEEEERRRLARELHDGVGQTLTALKNALVRLAASPGAPPADELRGAVALAAVALEETRQVSRRLRPPVLDDLGLEAALRALVRTLGERADFRVALFVHGALDGLPPDLETLLLRVSQEGLTNALKHSGAAGAELEIVRRSDRIGLAVRDRGRGCVGAQALVAGELSGMGLHSVRDRVSLFGGSFRFESAPGEGTVLAISLPLGEEAR